MFHTIYSVDFLFHLLLRASDNPHSSTMSSDENAKEKGNIQYYTIIGEKFYYSPGNFLHGQ